MPINYATLTTEINTDPKSLGLVALRNAGNHAGIAAKLNELGASAETLFKGYVQLEELQAEIVLAEYNALTAVQKTLLDQMFRGTRVKTGSANMRATIGALFPAGATRTALLALAQRPASRSEILFGEGTSVNDSDVATALAT